MSQEPGINDRNAFMRPAGFKFLQLPSIRKLKSSPTVQPQINSHLKLDNNESKHREKEHENLVLGNDVRVYDKYSSGKQSDKNNKDIETIDLESEECKPVEKISEIMVSEESDWTSPRVDTPTKIGIGHKELFEIRNRNNLTFGKPSKEPNDILNGSMMLEKQRRLFSEDRCSSFDSITTASKSEPRKKSAQLVEPSKSQKLLQPSSFPGFRSEEKISEEFIIKNAVELIVKERDNIRIELNNKVCFLFTCFLVVLMN